MKYKILISVLFLLTLASALVYYYIPTANIAESGFIAISSVMSGETDSLYKKADKVIEFKFPDDYGAHDEYKLEWWYFTGNLRSSEGKSFGYQFTIFRNALSPSELDIESGLASNQVYFAHIGISDIDAAQHHHFEKFARGNGKLAGSSFDPLNIFVENWSISGDYDNNEYLKPAFKINAEIDDNEIQLNLKPIKDMVLHGNNGLSPKSNEPGNASYYYSFTRIATEGTIKIRGKSYNVEGSSWMDREWSTSALSENQVGWDWFSIQLDNHEELMLFRLRDSINNTNFAKGTFISSNGDCRHISQEELLISPLRTHKLQSGTVYPNEWNLNIPSLDLDLNVKVRFPEQEMKLTVKYYEGSINVEGNYRNQKISGKGFVELTGY